jgi:hypothetical protein
MDILPDEPVPEELKLSEMEIMKNRCDLVESQIKILQKMTDDTINENKQLKDLIEKLYFMIQEMEEEGSSTDEEEETVAIPFKNS